ncbi:uncharacterized protein TRAVEDRAFT_25178 [Trametes versicolor FP-101664 SS1]|uniref:Uncharacterized protein n=1 Tax=Trametes versicolor (strain FP-101664) TaxID=717944 RepID=R7S834_TRAVS|nr:uncharacterized protein TRAVEDRAFT_25178 [Trametes versicolor FP-101664 SS1]EIW51109.1 hypothetical protein TRAVEDRAFT_25178 [Trametes versicolor FP-101664 SS1]
MVKSRSKGKGVSRKIKRYTLEPTRPGSGSSTIVSQKAFSPQGLVDEKEKTQRRIDQVLTGLGDRAIEQIRNLNARADQTAGDSPMDDNHHELQEAGDAMDVDNAGDVDADEATGDVLYALRDFMGTRYAHDFFFTFVY